MKVLIADNVRLFQQLISSLFANTGITPVVTDSAQDCLAKLHSEQFEFICISMHLQDMSGIDLCRHIRQSEKHAHTPVILFTSEYSTRLLNQALAAGVTEVFNKTRDIDQLVAYIKRFSLQHMPLHGDVLYVEDSSSLRMSTGGILAEQGLTIDSFATAEDAWEAFQKKRYHLVITDIVLAGQMSGLSLVNNIRRMNDRRGDTPILAVTGFDDIARRIELFQLGVNDYAIKPLIKPELLARVRYLLSSSSAIDRQFSLIEKIFHYSLAPVMVADQNGQIQKINQAFQDLVGQAEPAVLQKGVADFLGEAFTTRLFRDIDFKSEFETDAALQTVEGESREMHLAVSRLDDNASVIGHFLLIFSPIAGAAL